ncbi:MAG: ribonuclease HII [Coriobacteriia bacterium]|nr:ribonuclease HII [Coriobacteriia bacterium]
MDDLYRTEERLRRQRGYRFIAGADEAGRGALAGPLMVGVVVLDAGKDAIPWLDDSKKMTVRRRAEACERIKEEAIAWAVGSADIHTIDKYGPDHAESVALVEAFKDVKTQLEGVNPDILLIDGDGALEFPSDDVEVEYLVGGDSTVAVIAAASVVAKEARDEYMRRLCELGEGSEVLYNFDVNKGYPTAAHIKVIKKHGFCEHHRLRYLKKHMPYEILTEEYQKREKKIAAKKKFSTG